MLTNTIHVWLGTTIARGDQPLIVMDEVPFVNRTIEVLTLRPFEGLQRCKNVTGFCSLRAMFWIRFEPRRRPRHASRHWVFSATSWIVGVFFVM